jgi:hypothetical protein
MTRIPQHRGRAGRGRPAPPSSVPLQSGAAWKRSAQAAVASGIVLSAGLGNAATAMAASSLLPTAGGTTPGTTSNSMPPASSGSSSSPLGSLPLVGGGSSPLSSLPLVGGGSGGSSPLGNLPLVGGITGPATSTPTDPDVVGTEDHPAPGTISSSSNATYSFNGADGHAYQEPSLTCNVEGGTCTHFHGIHVPTGGPTGGDYYRIDANSIAVAPCTPQSACYVWNSPLFTYSARDAKNWLISFQKRTTFLLGGDGHAALYAEIVDEHGNVVTTAYHPELPLPVNRWIPETESFDGTRMVPGKQYRIRIIFCTLHAESAVSTGHVDIADPQISVSDQVGQPPVGACRANTALDAPPAMQPSANLDLCSTTYAVGQDLKPLTSTVLNILQSDGMVALQDKLSGATFVLRLEGQQLISWLVPREAVPSLYPSDLVYYVQGGGAGGLVDGTLVSVVRIPQSAVNDLLGNPKGLMATVTDVVQGKLGDLPDLLNPNRLLDVAVGESLTKFLGLVNEVLQPLTSSSVPPTELGGTVWCDNDQDGILDQGEQPVAGLTVRLLDTSGATIAETKTDANWKFKFSKVLENSAPTFYYIYFDRSSLPPGTPFTVKYAPGSTHANDSSADQNGMTQPIQTWRQTSDDSWNAGAVCNPNTPSIPCPPAGGLVCPSCGASSTDTTTDTTTSTPAGSSSTTTQTSPASSSGSPDLLSGLLSPGSNSSSGSSSPGGSSSPLGSLTGILGGGL